jgi:hypothetical protein
MNKDHQLLSEAYEKVLNEAGKIVMGHGDPYGVAGRQYRNRPNPYKANPQPQSEQEKRLDVEVRSILAKALGDRQEVQQWMDLITTDPKKAKEELYKIVSSQHTDPNKAEYFEAILNKLGLLGIA